MQAIKSLVIILGVLIMIGIALLGYGFFVRLTDPDFRVLKSGAPPPPVKAGGAMLSGDVHLALPEGCSVAEMHADGQRLYLRTRPAEGGPAEKGPAGMCERILVVDAATGQLRGTIILKP
jgi:hypothetical protein